MVERCKGGEKGNELGTREGRNRNDGGKGEESEGGDRKRKGGIDRWVEEGRKDGGEGHLSPFSYFSF